MVAVRTVFMHTRAQKNGCRSANFREFSWPPTMTLVKLGEGGGG